MSTSTSTSDQPRVSGEMRRKSQVENLPPRWEKKTDGTGTRVRSESQNPVGGASAFAWMNPSGGGKKTSAAAGE